MLCVIWVFDVGDLRGKQGSCRKHIEFGVFPVPHWAACPFLPFPLTLTLSSSPYLSFPGFTIHTPPSMSLYLFTSDGPAICQSTPYPCIHPPVTCQALSCPQFSTNFLHHPFPEPKHHLFMFFGDAARLAELLEHCVFFGVYFVGQDKSILTTQRINKIHHKINGKVLASSQHLWAIPGCKVSKSVIIGKISKKMGLFGLLP